MEDVVWGKRNTRMVTITLPMRAFNAYHVRLSPCRLSDFRFPFVVAPPQTPQARRDDVGVQRDPPGERRHGDVVSIAV